LAVLFEEGGENRGKEERRNKKRLEGKGKDE